MTPLIRVAALALLRDDLGSEELLLVRKRGTRRFMLPGGKLEPGESVLCCLARELREELGLALGPDAAPLGPFQADAANEADHRVEAMLYVQELAPDARPEPAAEIEEIRWHPIQAAQDSLPLAPLVATHLLPLLRMRSAGRPARNGF